MKAALAIASLALVGLVACSRRVTCGAAVVERCQSKCGSGSASRDTREGACEGVLRDLCLAHCAEECGGSSGGLAERIAALEAELDHGCGSGHPMTPEEHPRVKSQPTPGPLDRLML